MLRFRRKKELNRVQTTETDKENRSSSKMQHSIPINTIVQSENLQNKYKVKHR